MHLRFLWKTDQSNTGQCPALYEVEGGYVVQGRQLDTDARAQLQDLADDEDAIWVPADVIERIRER